MPDSATIHLVRHAEAEDDGEDARLTAFGEDQARALAKRFEGREVALIVHSPRRRGVETAAALATAFPGIECSASDLLDDRTPVPSDARRAEYSDRFLEWANGVPERERDPDGLVIGSALNELFVLARERADVGAIIAVTHNFVIGGMIQQVLEAPTALWTKFDSGNAAVTTIEWAQGRMKLVSFNETVG